MAVPVRTEPKALFIELRLINLLQYLRNRIFHQFIFITRYPQWPHFAFCFFRNIDTSCWIWVVTSIFHPFHKIRKILFQIPLIILFCHFINIVQFFYLDLSLTDSIMQGCYSVLGPEPRPLSCMLRSYLLTLKLKVPSITVWYRMPKETPLYAILSGFSFGDTPGVGTFYDFFSRIWLDDSNNLSPKNRFSKMKLYTQAILFLILL